MSRRAARLTYTLREYADMLGVSTQTVVTWAEKRKIPGEKIEGRWIFRKPEIDEWFCRQRVGVDEEAA